MNSEPSVDPDRPWIADLPACQFQCCDHVLAAVTELRIDHRREAREGVDDGEHADLAAGRQLDGSINVPLRLDLAEFDSAELVLTP